MDQFVADNANRDSSPLTTPPTSTPGNSPRGSRAVSVIADAKASPPNRTVDVVTRSSSRLAARRAQSAIKRTFEVMHPTELEAQKRPRRSVRTAVKMRDGCRSESEHSQPLQPAVDEEHSQDNSMQSILGSMASARGRRTESAMSLGVTKIITQRPPGVGSPMVWANGRGSLCEALPYFKAHKGSLYSSSLVAQGMLVDQEADRLDVFGAQVLISGMSVSCLPRFLSVSAS